MKNIDKKIGLLLAIVFCFALGASAQEQTTTVKPDTTRISWGNKKIIIIDEEEDDSIDSSEFKHKRAQRWNHFAGLDLGVNGLLTEGNSVDLGQEEQFMDLNYRKSISFAINFMEFYIPVAKEKLGFSTGMGIEFNKYTLDRDVTIASTEDTTIGVVDVTKDINKNLLKTTMVNVPLFLETNIGKDAAHSFHLAVGGMVSYRLGSKTKQKFEQDGKDHKAKDRTDFNMNDFRFNAVARVGYGDFTLFASYSLTPMFDKDDGPELYPFTVGISLVSF